MEQLDKIKDFISKNFSAKQTFEQYYNSGVDAFGKQDYERAINFFKSAIEQKDVQSQVYYNLALSYQCMKDYDRAIITYPTSSWP